MLNNELLAPTEVIRAKRKSISLIIKNNGDFIVRAPLKSKDEDIYKFINEKANWIIKKREEQLNNKITPLTFNQDEKISILGRVYTISYSQASRAKLTENELVLPKEKSKEKLISFLKNTAKKYITERVRLISQLFGFNFSSISISSAKTCWGSCGYNNKLHFTYKLMMCPQDVIDYVVLHELCHTKVKNHSKKFWQLVEECNPYYKTHERWLKKNRGIIELI